MTEPTIDVFESPAARVIEKMVTNLTDSQRAMVVDYLEKRHTWNEPTYRRRWKTALERLQA